MPTNNTTALLLYSGHQDYELTELNTYKELLNQQNITYDTYNWEEYPSYNIPEQYKAIFCYASNGLSGELSDTLSIALMHFLDSGTAQSRKNLFFASDGWAYQQSGQPNSNPETKLLNAYFRAFFVPEGTGGGTNGIAGPSSMGYSAGTILTTDVSPIGIPGSLYDVYANSPDCIIACSACPDWYANEVQHPEIGAQNAFAFEGGPVNGQAYLYHGVCATSIDLGIYRAYYFSFDLSQLSLPDQRTTFIHDMSNWFGLFDDSNLDNSTSPLTVTLCQNYPNPFNPETTIEFSVQSSSPTKIEIFNVKGQLVKTLCNGQLQSGTHKLIWDGTNNNSQHISSGIYYCRLVNDGIVKTTKMLLIK